MFGASLPPQSEKTPFYPRSPYAVSKLSAHWMTINYREAYNMYTCNGILFNHESPVRGETFVTQKIIKGLINIKKGRQKKLKEIAQQDFTQVLYESPHRLLKLIKEIALYFGEEKQLSISKEITKIHENHFRGTAKDMYQIFSSTPIKGEFVVVIEKNKNNK